MNKDPECCCNIGKSAHTIKAKPEWVSETYPIVFASKADEGMTSALTPAECGGTDVA